MKKHLISLGAWIALVFVSYNTMAQTITPVVDTIVMGPGYINEVYYSMSGGIQSAVNRKQWDIAFRTSRMSASILTNDAANNNGIGLNGVELYTYPAGDTSAWTIVDTAGFSSWKNLVNSTTDWETGAFCQNQLGHPDYGWGRYNSASHDVLGDSLYVIKLRDGSLRKLWVIRKYSSLNKFEFRVARLDGSGDTTVMLDCAPYSTRNFLGYSLTDNKIVDFEQVDAASWDILFTKYMYTYPEGTLYPVTGVLSNYGVKVSKYEQVPVDYRQWDYASMDSTRSPIGWEWKYLDDIFVYHVVDSMVYFVQDLGGNIHRLVFKQFSGSSSGRIALEKEMISLASTPESTGSTTNLALYPNPAADLVNIIVNPGHDTKLKITITDLSGRELHNHPYLVKQDELNTITLPISAIPEGIYMVSLTTGLNKITRKLLVKR